MGKNEDKNKELLDRTLNFSKDIIEFSNNFQEIEEDDLIIDNVLNLDAFTVLKIQMKLLNIKGAAYNESDDQSTVQESDIEWVSNTEADRIVDLI